MQQSPISAAPVWMILNQFWRSNPYLDDKHLLVRRTIFECHQRTKALPKRDLIVIGGSAGALEAVQVLTRTLPKDFDAAMLVVLHTSNHAGSLLPQIVSRAGKIPAIHPVDDTPIEKGRIYIAPPDYHMIVDAGRIRVLQGPKENLHRPAIDPLFRSAAAFYGPRVIGVVLSGVLDDGTSGLMVIRSAGGEAVVQDPREALFAAMPRHALEQVPDAHVTGTEGLSNLLMSMTQGEVEAPPAQNNAAISQAIREVRLAEANMSEIEGDEHVGKPSSLGCPDCGGVLWEIEQGDLLRFRCRVGHAYTARHLETEQRHTVEVALWAALRALEESASLYRRMAARAKTAKHIALLEQYEERADDKEKNARILREFLVHVNAGLGSDSPEQASKSA